MTATIEDRMATITPNPPHIVELPQGPVLKTLWGAYRTTDGGFGTPGTSKNIGWYLTKPEALVGAQGQGEWGSNGSVQQGVALELDGKLYLLAQPEPIELKSISPEEFKADMLAKALKKLTPAERALLGVA